MRIAAVIPARMQSVRLPGKPLRLINGVPMVLRVLQRAKACPGVDRVIVATDSEEVLRVVEAGGGEAWMTSPDHRSGSDRVAEVAEKLSEELILNLQGDVPFLPVSTVEELIQFAVQCKELTVATAVIHLPHEGDIVNPNIVKVVGTRTGRALYFSRFPIPYRSDEPLDLNADRHSSRLCPGYYKHIGIYIYRREFLLEFVRLEPSPLELSESLEQLRTLEHGYPVYLVKVAEDSIGVDTPEDLSAAEVLAAAQEGTFKY
jgi:3-deoxy-manno-octulosonate cytidylyltransferase (CMP-KDO synthetase)